MIRPASHLLFKILISQVPLTPRVCIIVILITINSVSTAKEQGLEDFLSCWFIYGNVTAFLCFKIVYTCIYLVIVISLVFQSSYSFLGDLFSVAQLTTLQKTHGITNLLIGWLGLTKVDIAYILVQLWPSSACFTSLISMYSHYTLFYSGGQARLMLESDICFCFTRYCSSL